MNSSPSSHNVQFYKSESFLFTTLNEFVRLGLSKGEGVIIIATSEHNRKILFDLSSSGIDIQQLLDAGQLLILDAEVTLNQFMMGECPDPDLFLKIIGETIDKLSQSFPIIRAYGEMVNILWANKNLTGTHALEELWNKLTETRSFSLLCGYQLDNFITGIDEHAITEVCRRHSQ